MQRNDGEANLLGAMTIAAHFRIPEVCLYFNNKLFRGNRYVCWCLSRSGLVEVIVHCQHTTVPLCAFPVSILFTTAYYHGDKFESNGSICLHLVGLVICTNVAGAPS